MDKELAKQLIPLVNNANAMLLLEMYCDNRIKRHHADMEQCSVEKLKGHQDAIAELKRFKTLRKEVIEKAS